MKVRLMHAEQDFDVDAQAPALARELSQDLELDTLLDAMAAGDKFLRPVAEVALLHGLTRIEAIAYRQQVLADCQRCRPVVEKLYELTVETIEEERQHFHFSTNRASSLLDSAVRTMSLFQKHLGALRQMAETEVGSFQSPAFIRFFRMLREELSDDYLDEITAHLKELNFKHGLLISARLGTGSKAVDLVLRELPEHRRGRWQRLLHRQPETHAFDLHPRDQAGGRALDELRNRGLDVAAHALGQAADHVLSFFKQLRIELGFYRSALNLQDALKKQGMPTCTPEPLSVGTRAIRARGVYDPCLCLTANQSVVGNDVVAEGCNLIFVTGANQGGKSTFVRSLGLAQLMMQAGLFVPAQSFARNICTGVFTHYKREEDAGMQSGKFEEELLRMDAIVDQIEPHGLVLFNESFAATNEHEGTGIADEIIDVLVEKRVQILFVTHFYELPLIYIEAERSDTLFLRAERNENGDRTHRILPGKPSTTAYGPDLYARIFSDREAAAPRPEQAQLP